MPETTQSTEAHAKSINYYVEEQYRVITEVYQYLASTDVIHLKDYVELSRRLGSGMITKLRLTPGPELSTRLSHLFALVECAVGVKPIFDDQILCSFESLNPAYRFDCDIILEHKGVTYLIDFTANASQQNVEKKQAILATKMSDPSLQGIPKDFFVEIYKPVRFEVDIEFITRNPSMSNPETFTLRLLDLMAGSSGNYNRKFVDNCKQVYEKTIEFMAKSSKEPPNYNPARLNAEKVEIAVKASQSNSVSDILRLFSITLKKQYDPFINTLSKVTSQFSEEKPPFVHRAAKSTNDKISLQYVLEKLSDDHLAKVLHQAECFEGSVFGVTEKGDLEQIFTIPLSASNKRVIAYESRFRIIAQKQKGHYFTIYFHYDAMSDQLKRSILGENKPKNFVQGTTTMAKDAILSKIKEQEGRLHDITRKLNKRLEHKSDSNIWSKIKAYGSLAKDDTGALGKVSANLLNSCAHIYSNCVAGSLIGHQYEIVKSFASAVKNSHKGETYYVGTNGSYLSVTVSKISSTQDSFDRSHYCVISKDFDDPELKDLCWKKHTQSGTVSRSDFRTMDRNDIAYNLRLPYYVMSLFTWDIESSLENGFTNKSDYPEKIANSTLHCLVNRDTFAQSAQQVRYLYMSSIGYGADPSKIADKIDFFRPRTTWEYVYVVRMLKMGLSLSIVRDNRSLGSIVSEGEVKAVFPHTSKVPSSFNHIVSSMYYCNIFNKFRAFHEVSEAFCYNDLDKEFEIYKKTVKNNPSHLTGFSTNSIEAIDDEDYFLGNEFVDNEYKFCLDLIAQGQGRYKASVPFIIGAANKHLKASDDLIAGIYQSVSVSPIDACTMRGSMKRGEITDKGQGCRAASAILEELIAAYDIDPEKLNSNSWLSSVLMDKIEKGSSDMSIMSLLVIQLGDESIKYFYRIVDKDQIGNREISVLNALFRIGALFVENIAKCISRQIQHVDLLESPDKDYIFEQHVSHVQKESKKAGRITCYDNSDQKRWGPNHMLNFFAAMFYGIMPSERGLLKMIYHVCDKTLQKEAKFPESLIALFNKMRDQKIMTSEGIQREHGSQTLIDFYKTHANDILNKIYSTEFPNGMCQGIYHATSSIFHAIMCKAVEDVTSRVFVDKVIMKSFCTSDDSFRTIQIDRDQDQIEVVKRIHANIIMVNSVSNIIRNDAKSSFNFHVAEFNSIFSKNGTISTPSIKQRISKIDVGSGQNHIEDYLAALSSSANYFTVGGSYSGCVILTILNLVLHTEQWNRWQFIKKEKYNLPVELGGFPVIEPFSTCISGAISNLYLRSESHLSVKEYAELFASIMTEKPELYDLSDFARIPKKLIDEECGTFIYKNSGALGINSLVRTDKKLSQFEKRHSMSKWDIPDHFLTLKHFSSDSRFFLYNIYKTGCMSLYTESLGVNSFFIRFTDPWVSKERRCVRVSKRSFLTKLGFSSDERYTYQNILDELHKIKVEDGVPLLKDLASEAKLDGFTDPLITQLIPRLRDSREILRFVRNQECSDYIEPRHQPSTSRITLTGAEALDEEKYTLDIIKQLSGEKSRYLIIEYYNDHRRFDQIPSAKDCPNIDLKDAILLAENSVHAFNKYIKRNTKMITSGRPDSLTTMITMTLKSRFFEGLGVKLIGKLNLVGDRQHAFSYTTWYKDLSEKSQDYVNKKADSSVRQLYSDVVKYGIISDLPSITERDHFEVAPIALARKHVRVTTKAKSSLISFVKSWVSVNADFSLSFDTIQSILAGKLINRYDFRISENLFVRSAHSIYFNVTLNNLPVLHLIETDTSANRPSYRHIFLCESNSLVGNVKFELTETGKERDWAVRICDFFSSQGPTYLNRDYRLARTRHADTVVFKSLDPSIAFDLDVCPFSLTIAFRNPSYTIPVCFSSPSRVSNMKCGYVLNHNDLLHAANMYASILERTDDLTKVSENMSKSLNYILYKTHAGKSSQRANFALHINKFPFTFDNSNQLDIFKTLLMDDRATTKTINSSRFMNYVNNLFKAPTDKNNYLSELTFEDRMTLAQHDTHDSSDDHDDRSGTGTEKTGSVVSDDSDIDLIDNFDFEFEYDDVELEALVAEDMLDEDEGLFEAFNIGLDSDEIEQTSIKTSRSGLTVNPNQEFPYQIINYLRAWSSENKLLRRQGVMRDADFIQDLPRVYLNSIRLAGGVRPDIFHFLTGKDSIELPCELADLNAVRAIMSS